MAFNKIASYSLFFSLVAGGCREVRSERTGSPSETDPDIALLSGQLAAADMVYGGSTSSVVAAPTQLRVKKPCPDSIGLTHPDQGSGLCTGNLALHLPLPTVGMEIVYNSLGSMLQYGFGNGWGLAVERIIFHDKTNHRLRLLAGDGTEASFVESSSQSNRFVSSNSTGDATVITYVPASKTFTISRPDGTFVDFSQHSSVIFLIAHTRERHNLTTTFLRNTSGQITDIVGPFGSFLKIEYGSNPAATIQDRAGSTYQMFLDSEKRLSKVVLADSSKWSFTYHPQTSLIFGATSPNSETTSYHYIGLGVLFAETSALGVRTVYRYSDSSVEAKSAAEVQIESFDRTGKVVTIERNGQFTRFTRDAAGRVVQIQAADDTKSNFTYDGSSRRQKEDSYADGAFTRYTYDEGKNLTKISTVSGNLFSHVHFSPSISGLPTKIDDQGFITEFSYNAVGDLTQITKDLEKVYLASYDGTGNVLTETNEIGLTTTYEYADGELSKEIDPFGQTVTYVRNKVGIPTKISSSLLSIEPSYDLLGQLNGKLTVTSIATGIGARKNLDLQRLVSGLPQKLTIQSWFKSTVAGQEVRLSEFISTFDKVIPGKLKTQTYQGFRGGAADTFTQ